MMNVMKPIKRMDAGTKKLERAEESDPRVLRVAARWCRLCLEEELTPYEATVAWKRVALLLMAESPSELTTRAVMGLLATELGLHAPVMVPGESLTGEGVRDAS